MDGSAALGGHSGGARKEGDVAGLSLLLCDCDFWRLLCLPETVGECGTGALVLAQGFNDPAPRHLKVAAWAV